MATRSAAKLMPSQRCICRHLFSTSDRAYSSASSAQKVVAKAVKKERKEAEPGVGGHLINAKRASCTTFFQCYSD